MRIPIAFVTDKNFIMQIGVVITMLAKNRSSDNELDIRVVMGDCDDESVKIFEGLSCEGISVKVIPTTLSEFSGINQIAHISSAGLIKFKLAEILSDCEKFIYIDGDIIVRGDLGEFYSTELGDSYVAGVADIESIFEDEKLMNSGVMLMNGTLLRRDKMFEKLLATRKSLGDRRSMDQQSFNICFKNRIKFLPVKYNCVSTKLVGKEKKNHPTETVNRLYETAYKDNLSICEDALIIHFATTDKPWKYTFVPYGDEWYEYYKNSPWGGVKLQRKSAFGAHVEGFKRHFREGGLQSVFRRAKKIILAKMGKKEKTNWG